MAARRCLGLPSRLMIFSRVRVCTQPSLLWAVARTPSRARGFATETSPAASMVPPAQARGVPRFMPAQSPPNGRPGDWVCPNPECGDINFAFREVCRKCPTDRHGVIRDVAPGTTSGGWNCSSCKHVNFQWRQECQKCHEPKPGHLSDAEASLNHHQLQGYPDPAEHHQQQQSVPSAPPSGDAGRYPPGQARGAPRGALPGDWICPNCSDLCFASRQACRMCGTARPAQTGVVQELGFQSKMLAGDWRCSQCTYHVFKSSGDQCPKCGAQRPLKGD